MKFRSYKSIVTLLILLVLFNFVSWRPAYALDKSRFFTFLLFASGIGSSVAGAVMQSQATETYDKYLHTANQAEMESLIDDYEKKHSQGIIVSRTGIGVVIGAILISLIDVANIPTPVEQNAPTIFSSEIKSYNNPVVNLRAYGNEMTLSVNQRF